VNLTRSHKTKVKSAIPRSKLPAMMNEILEAKDIVYRCEFCDLLLLLHQDGEVCRRWFISGR
jgi:hypothetical protein